MKVEKALKLLNKEAKSLYDANPVTIYHTWGHAKRVRKHATKLYGKLELTSAVKLAASWHDAYYEIGDPPGVNEKASADLLRGAYSRLRPELSTDKAKKFMDLIVEEAALLICGTCMNNVFYPAQVELRTLACLLDADLSLLGAKSYEKFVDTQAQLIREQGYNPADKLSVARHAQGLSNFLTCRDFIFHTKKARTKWEDLARANVGKYVHNAAQEASLELGEKLEALSGVAL